MRKFPVFLFLIITLLGACAAPPSTNVAEDKDQSSLVKVYKSPT